MTVARVWLVVVSRGSASGCIAAAVSVIGWGVQHDTGGGVPPGPTGSNDETSRGVYLPDFLPRGVRREVPAGD